MDSRGAALNLAIALTVIGIVAVSCSDSEDKQATDDHQIVHEVVQMPVSVQAHVDETVDHVDHADLHWDYSGAGAPQHWAKLDQAFATCDRRMQQSPIDIAAITTADLQPITFHYQEAALEVVNNGYTVQVNYPPGSYIKVGNQAYDLLQFHFHSPSGHTVGGKSYDMVAHFVHQSASGNLAVVGVLFRLGEVNRGLAKVWLNMPQTPGAVKVDGVTINAADLLPDSRAYFAYSGSQTTPPCSEGVDWMVLASPESISPQQLAEFTKIFPANARSVQPLHGRTVRASD